MKKNLINGLVSWKLAFSDMTSSESSLSKLINKIRWTFSSSPTWQSISKVFLFSFYRSREKTHTVNTLLRIFRLAKTYSIMRLAWVQSNRTHAFNRKLIIIYILFQLGFCISAAVFGDFYLKIWIFFSTIYDSFSDWQLSSVILFAFV